MVYYFNVVGHACRWVKPDGSFCGGEYWMTGLASKTPSDGLRVPLCNNHVDAFQTVYASQGYTVEFSSQE
jgi:hypothetical protein